MVLSDYKLDVKAARLSHLADEADCSLRFSPTRRIEDAMDLLDALPGLIGWWHVSYCMVHIHSGEDQPRFSVDVTVGYGMDTGRTKTQAITEAFIAAMEANDVDAEKIDQLSTRIRNGEIDPEKAAK